MARRASLVDRPEAVALDERAVARRGLDLGIRRDHVDPERGEVVRHARSRMAVRSTGSPPAIGPWDRYAPAPPMSGHGRSSESTRNPSSKTRCRGFHPRRARWRAQARDCSTSPPGRSTCGLPSRGARPGVASWIRRSGQPGGSRLVSLRLRAVPARPALQRRELLHGGRPDPVGRRAERIDRQLPATDVGDLAPAEARLELADSWMDEAPHVVGDRAGLAGTRIASHLTR